MERIFGYQLKRAMIQNCVGVQELSEKTGIRVARLSRILAANESRVRLSTLGRLAQALKIPYITLTLKDWDEEESEKSEKENQK